MHNAPKHSNTVRPVGRFAPSPTGRMHMGNLFSYLIQYLYVKQRGGKVILRIENLDRSRSKQEYIDRCFSDMDLFGFEYDGPVVYQSNRDDLYYEAFHILEEKGLIYPCFCSRADLHAIAAPHPGEEFVYPGTCRNLITEERCMAHQIKDPSYRVIVPEGISSYSDLFQGIQKVSFEDGVGDFVVRRADKLFAYQLAVVVDDYSQGVTSVIRGSDLLNSTHKQLYLAKVLGLNSKSPEDCSEGSESSQVTEQGSYIEYGHVPLIVTSEGVRLSKRNRDASMEYLLNELKWNPEQVLSYLAFFAGLIPDNEVLTLDELIKEADLSAINNAKTLIWKQPVN